jgi:hypothetical protein
VAKTLWKNTRNLRLPNPNWQSGRAAAWFAGRLGLPSEAVVLLRPSGRIARADKSIGALRKEWDEELR